MKNGLLIFAVLLCLLCAGCAKEKETGQPTVPKAQTDVQTSAEQNAEADKPETEEQAPLPPSKNKEIVTEENAPKVYWAMDIIYHLENCKTLTETKPQEVPWSLVKEIGLRQCPECNPPQYEGYVENE